MYSFRFYVNIVNGAFLIWKQFNDRPFAIYTDTDVPFIQGERTLEIKEYQRIEIQSAMYLIQQHADDDYLS